MAIRSQFGGGGSELVAFMELASDPAKYKAMLDELNAAIIAANKAHADAEAKVAEAATSQDLSQAILARAADGQAALDARAKELEDRIAAFEMQEAARNAKLDLREADMRDVAMNLESQKASIADHTKANADQAAGLEQLHKDLLQGQALLEQDRAALEVAHGELIEAQAKNVDDVAKLRAGFAALDVAVGAPPPPAPAPAAEPPIEPTPPAPVEPAPIETKADGAQ